MLYSGNKITSEKNDPFHPNYISLGNKLDKEACFWYHYLQAALFDKKNPFNIKIYRKVIPPFVHCVQTYLTHTHSRIRLDHK